MQRNNLIYRVGEAVYVLMRQAVNQIDVNAVKAQFARVRNQIASKFIRLNAMNRLLHFRMEILHTHTEAVEAQFAKNVKMRAVRNPRIDFDAQFCVRRKRKSFARKREQVFNLLRSEIRRRSSAPVKLYNWPRTRNAEADAINFLF